MASEKQREAARKNVGNAIEGAKKKQTLKHKRVYVFPTEFP
jgi:hypothetical protein